jgi:prepilin-type N-terminal cleavage/methylation domain-containing protein
MKSSKNFSSLNSNFSFQKGFTLIELLIVIVVLRVLATVVMVAINPLGMINSANLAKTKTFAASIENLLSISQVGKWSFEESASPSKDTSGYSNNGTWGGGVTSMAEKDCVFGKCLNFNDGYISLPSINPTSAITISLWVKSANSSGYHGSIIDKVSAFSLGLVNSLFPKDLRFSLFSSPNSQNVGSAVEISDPNNWHYFVLTFDSSTGRKKVYVDGVVIADDSFSGTIYPATGPIEIGRQVGSPGDSFYGLIDEVAIYSQALTFAQIQQLYAQGLISHQLALK